MPNSQLEYPPMPDVEAAPLHRRFQRTASYAGVHDIGDVSGDIVIDLRRRNVQRLRLVGDVTSVTFVRPPGSGTFKLWIYQDGTGGRTISNWDAGAKWGGTAPVISADAGNFDLAVFEYDDGALIYAPQVAQGIDGLGFNPP